MSNPIPSQLIQDCAQILLQEKTEKFGEILFGDARKLKERDTEFEKKVYQLFQQYTSYAYGEDMSDDIVHAFKELLQLKNEGYYKDILEPNARMIHRGLKFNFFTKAAMGRELRKWGLTPAKLRNILNRGGKFNLNYKPQAEIESWTPHPGPALHFIYHDNRDLYHGMVIKAAADKRELLFNSDFINQYGKYKEYEIIRVSDKPIQVEAHVRMNMQLRKKLL